MKSAYVLLACTAMLSGPVLAGGEAGPISLRDQGFFWVGARPNPVAKGLLGGGSPRARARPSRARCTWASSCAANKPPSLSAGAGARWRRPVHRLDGNTRRPRWLAGLLPRGGLRRVFRRPPRLMAARPTARAYGELANSRHHRIHGQRIPLAEQAVSGRWRAVARRELLSTRPVQSRDRR